MKVILLKGHGRGITQLRYNAQGDLLFSASKGKEINLWWADNGERIGTYLGHTGSVYAIDVTRDSKLLLTGAADNRVKIWDVESGKELFSLSTITGVRSVRLAQGESRFMVATDNVLGYSATIQIFPFSHDKDELVDVPTGEIVLPSRMKVTDTMWGPLNKHIFATTDDGRVMVYDGETLKLVHEITDHLKGKEVKRIQWSPDRLSFLTASTDHTARLYDASTFKQVKMYETGRPCNSAAFGRNTSHVFLAGGQAADEVTVTRVDPTMFASRIFHKVYQEELGLVQGHFGPVNDLQVNPNGRSFATGGEDGYVRINFFDDSYYNGLSDEMYLKKMNERIAAR